MVAKLIAAVAYYRMSTDKQETSIRDQRNSVEAWAAENGYVLIGEYLDEGVSGWKSNQREGFTQMMADAEASKFEAILCWDSDRFSRFPVLEANHYWFLLDRAGVHIATVAEGRLDFDDIGSWAKNSFGQHGKAEYSRSLSLGTARGQVASVERGYPCGQAAPYGYDRMLCDESGTPQQRVRGGEKFAKPKSWRTKWVPSEDVEHVETLRWLFKTYAENDIGMRAMADDLNGRGVPSARGGKWSQGAIREMLRNQAYVGDYVWNKKRQGQFHQIVGGRPKPRDKAETREVATNQVRKKVVANSPEDWIVHPDSHEPLVDRETFAIVQQRMEARRARVTSHKKRNGDRYLLSGLLYCAHCGGRMHGTCGTRKKGDTIYRYERYLCSTYATQGHGQCNHNPIHQDKIVAAVIEKIQAAVLRGNNEQRLRDQLTQMVASQRNGAPERIKSVEARLAKFDRDLQKRTKRLLSVPDGVAELLANELEQMRLSREAAAIELESLRTANRPVDVDATVERAMARVNTLSADLTTADRPRLREVIRQFVDRITLTFDHVKRGTRVECPFRSGLIEFKQSKTLQVLTMAGTGFEPATSRL